MRYNKARGRGDWEKEEGDRHLWLQAEEADGGSVTDSMPNAYAYAINGGRIREKLPVARRSRWWTIKLEGQVCKTGAGNPILMRCGRDKRSDSFGAWFAGDGNQAEVAKAQRN